MLKSYPDYTSSFNVDNTIDVSNATSPSWKTKFILEIMVSERDKDGTFFTREYFETVTNSKVNPLHFLDIIKSIQTVLTNKGIKKSEKQVLEFDPLLIDPLIFFLNSV